MKKYLLFILTIISLQAIGQEQKKNNGFAYVGATGFISAGQKAYGNLGGFAVGAGYAVGGHLSIGGSFEGFVFTKEHKQGTARLDASAFFKGVNNKMSPFISIQPGIVLASYSYGGKTTKGNFCFDALVGIKTKVNHRAGVYFAAGYSAMSYKTVGVVETYGGFKAKICLSL